MCKILMDAQNGLIEIEILNEDRGKCVLLADELNNQVNRFKHDNSIIWRLTGFGIIKILLFLGFMYSFAYIFDKYYLLDGIGNLSETTLSHLSLEQKMDLLIQIKFRSSRWFVTLGFIVLISFATFISIVFPSRKFLKYIFETEAKFCWGDALRDYEEEKSIRTKVRWGLFIIPLVLLLVKIFWKTIF